MLKAPSPPGSRRSTRVSLWTTTKCARQHASKRAEVARYFGVLGKPRGARVSASRHAEKDLRSSLTTLMRGQKWKNTAALQRELQTLAQDRVEGRRPPRAGRGVGRTFCQVEKTGVHPCISGMPSKARARNGGFLSVIGHANHQTSRLTVFANINCACLQIEFRSSR
jgi:hypothetical protein